MRSTVGCCFSELLLYETSTNTDVLQADIRKVQRYLRGSQKPQPEEEHTIQWPKGKG